MPTFPNTGGTLGRGIIARSVAAAIGKRPHGFRGYFRSPKGVKTFSITGLTVDSAGAPLGNCDVDLFRTSDDLFIDRTVSGEDGSYSFQISNGEGTFYLVAYKTGSPDVFGTTVNTIAAS